MTPEAALFFLDPVEIWPETGLSVSESEIDRKAD
jgi:hypothetical protein